jgi:uncharacterized membrane protein
MTAVWRAFFAMSLVLLALLAFSVPYVEPGTGTFVVTVLSAAMLGTMLVGSATLAYVEWTPFEDWLA